MSRTSALKNSKTEPAAIGGNRYFALGADGNVIPVGNHKVVRVENDLLARPIIVTAHRSKKEMYWKAAKKYAEGLDINGWSWRLPTVEEAFFIPDRANYPALPKEFFPDFEGYEWIWTSTPDAEAPSGFAWYVFLRGGDSSRFHQSSRGSVRAVRAGQF
jgi:hypothetical protein